MRYKVYCGRKLLGYVKGDGFPEPYELCGVMYKAVSWGWMIEGKMVKVQVEMVGNAGRFGHWVKELFRMLLDTVLERVKLGKE